MSITFRCQVCGQKMRVPSDFAVKKTRCKCGALIGDACELMCVWSPLFAELQGKNDRPITAGNRHPLLVVFASFLVVFFTSLGLAQYLRMSRDAARSNPAELLADSKKLQQQSDSTKDPGMGSGSVNRQSKSSSKVAGPPDETWSHQDLVKPFAAYFGFLAGEFGDRATTALGATTMVAWSAKSAGVTAYAVFVAEKIKTVEKMEIVDWYVAQSYDVVDANGKPMEPLSLNEKAVKDGFALVAVNVRLRSELLQGKNFDVLDSDVRLITPAKEDNIYGAFGCSVNKTQWFAPPKGKYPYNPGKEEFVVQSWVFPVPRADLESGRTLFQFRNDPPVLLTLDKRRK